MLEALYVVLEEHEAMRAVLGRIRRVVASKAGLAGIAAHVEKLSELAEVHDVTEGAVIFHGPHAGPDVLELSPLRNHALTRLRGLRRAITAAATVDELSTAANEVCAALEVLMAEEETRVHQRLAFALDARALWSLSVALDRAVDEAGRVRRRALIDEALGTPSLALYDRADWPERFAAMRSPGPARATPSMASGRLTA